MHARNSWVLLPILAMGMLACGGDDVVVDPNGNGSPAVVWMLSGDRSGESSGESAILELYTAGPDSYVELILQTNDGHTLRIGSPPGENSVSKTVYEVEESGGDDWHARLMLNSSGEIVSFAAQDGFLTVEEVTRSTARGFFHLETIELDGDENPVLDGERVDVQGTFSASIQRSSPGSRAVMKGGVTCRPIAALTTSY